mgnify:FL=1
MTETHQTAKLAYSVAEACAASSLGRTTIYALIANGSLDAVRVGGRTVIPVKSLNALVSGGASHLENLGENEI